ncbi:MAG: hypothetical protein IKJ31_03015 [Bacteroidaceae bacterium]|nr:hypothetical protein [Bacteroidaceae bacterium]
MKRILLHILFTILLLSATQSVQALGTTYSYVAKKEVGTIESVAKSNIESLTDILTKSSFELPHTHCVQHSRQQQSQWQCNGSHVGKSFYVYNTKHNIIEWKYIKESTLTVAKSKRGKSYYIFALRQIII